MSPGGRAVVSRLYTQYQKERKLTLHTEAYRRNNLQKARAHQAVHRALEKSLLIKPRLCEMCHQEKRLEAHHPDYDKPLDVVWLDRGCHKKLHKNM